MPDQQTQQLALMFVDIPTIGTIREQQGEAAARDRQQRCLSLLGDVRKEFAGNLVRSIGGTLLCSFMDVADAVEAAIGMQQAIVDSGLVDDGVSIRMGLHCGPVQIRGGNYSGEVVTVAARMVTLAKVGCIVATHAVYEGVSEALQRRFSPLAGDAPARLQLDLYEVDWGAGSLDEDIMMTPMERTRTQSKRKTLPKQLRVEDVKRPALKQVDLREVEPSEQSETKSGEETGERTEIRTGPSSSPRRLPPESKLCLIWQEKVHIVDADTALTLGRDSDNDVVLRVHTASRHHAEVSFRDGQFVLTDRSANGTFIYDEKGEEYFVHDGEARLNESGAICPGCPQEEPGCEALLYWMA